jgi:hypothetical protein
MLQESFEDVSSLWYSERFLVFANNSAYNNIVCT